MTTCPEEVQQYLDKHWEDVEPFEEPATIQGNDISLSNVWACWYDEHGDWHALDYSDGNLKGYVFTGAYPVKCETTYESVNEDISVRPVEFSFSGEAT